MNLIFTYHAMNDDVTIAVVRRVGRDYNYTTIFILDNLYLHNNLIEPHAQVSEDQIWVRGELFYLQLLTRSFLLEYLAQQWVILATCWTGAGPRALSTRSRAFKCI